MKRFLVFLIIAVISVSCKKFETPMNSYVINGNAPGIYNGVRVHLKSMAESGKEVIMDTAIVFDEKFKFEGVNTIPDVWYLSVNGVNGSVPFVIENGNLSIDFYKDSVDKSKITGSKSNDALTEYSLEVNKLTEKRFEVNAKSRELGTVMDASQKANISTELAGINKEMVEFPLKFIKSNTDNAFSLILIETLIKNNSVEIEKLEDCYNSIENDLKTSALGSRITSIFNAKKLESERANSLNIGKVAPDFSAPNTEGQLLALNDIKGKVTIIDFWASWCGPCRRENPNVVNVYNKYHDKGLEIIGVSLDRPGQKDKWLRAIEDDQLTWHHVSNLQYFNDPIAQLYNIKSIPATYILDSNGTIVAKNLRGPALESKIAELLN
jgi:peroxiredoxin